MSALVHLGAEAARAAALEERLRAAAPELGLGAETAYTAVHSARDGLAVLAYVLDEGEHARRESARRGRVLSLTRAGLGPLETLERLPAGEPVEEAALMAVPSAGGLEVALAPELRDPPRGAYVRWERAEEVYAHLA